MFDTISIFLNLLRFDLWDKIWSILENVPCAFQKKVFFSAFGWNVLKISMRSISSNVSFKICVSLLIFCFIFHLGRFVLVVQSLSHVDSLWPRGLWHAGLPCPSPSTGACSNSCPLSQGLVFKAPRLPGEISITSDMQMTPPLWQKVTRN